MSGQKKKDVGVIVHSKGASFRVWAPNASAVAVSGSFNNWAATPLKSENDGYWAGDIREAEPGQEYKFIIAGPSGELHKNDPRALQLTTVAGNSVIVDNAFEWEGDDFVPPPVERQVLYELHVGTFNRADPARIGSFEDAIAKLDHLADLGINMVELMPITAMSMDRGWGYAPDYLYAIESLYGGRHGFLEFVKAAHARGIGVIVDVVYNHFAADEHLDLWQFDGWSENGKGGIYFYNDWRSATPWGDSRPDYGRPEVRQFFVDNVRMWLSDCHVDGLRLDSTIYTRNVKGQNNDPANDIPEAWQLLQQITTVSRKIKPQAIVVAEDSSGNDYITKPTAEGGAGFTAQWEVPFPHVLRGALGTDHDEARNLADLAALLTHSYNGNAFQRIIYSDSHDTAANGGARLNEEITPGNAGSVYARKRLLLAAAIMCTAPGIPMLFQGQEFMAGGSFNDWQSLDWDKAEQFSGIVEAHRHLIALRKDDYGLTAGLHGQSTAIVHLDETNKVLAYHRWDQGGAADDVIVIINFANRLQTDYRLPLPRTGTWKVRFNSDWQGYSADFKNTTTEAVVVDNDSGSLTIAPYSVVILSQDR